MKRDRTTPDGPEADVDTAMLMNELTVACRHLRLRAIEAEAMSDHWHEQFIKERTRAEHLEQDLKALQKG